ncbi:MAG TPA: carboxypeptidase regulatory-like domain-containing protein [Gemmatimonadales bacterium]|nr:carboxypeptidase regulatory-like domain-containing protein [Gemmatimonadales bacterium]
MTASFRHRIRSLLAAVTGLVMLTPRSAHPQSATQGALQGEIVTANGLGVSEVTLTLEDEAGGVVRRLKSDQHGRFSLTLLQPGTYSMLAEKAGFQPFRQRGVLVRADQRTDLRIVVTRRPPPITRVEESAVADQRFVPAAPRISEALSSTDFERDAARLDLSESGRFATGVVPSGTDRWGLGDVVGSLPQSQTRLTIDGLPVFWMRHPGLETQPAGNGLVPPYLLQESRLIDNGSDGETPQSTGSLLRVVSRNTTRGFRIEPFVSLGGSPGLSSELNPADSAARSVQAGGVMSGTIVKDKAQFLVSGSYESLSLPGAQPWTRDTATFGGVGVPFGSTVEQIAQNTFGYDARSRTRPVLRTYRGGTGGMELDWQLSSVHRVTVRAGAAQHTEDSPELGLDLTSGAGSAVDSKDFLGSVALTSSWRSVSNEFRVGYQSTKRDWTSSGPAATYLVSDGAGFGPSPAAAASFDRDAFQLEESFVYQFGAAGENRTKFGFVYSSGDWDQNYLYGSKGIYQFGSLDLFNQGQGSFFDVSSPNSAVSFKVQELGLFGHLQYQISPNLSTQFGFRWDRQRFPTGLPGDTAFQTAFGLRNNIPPDDKVNLSPRLGFLWGGGGTAGWLVNLVGAIDNGQLNPELFAEAMLDGRDVQARRSVGTFSGWPSVPSTAALPLGGRRFALFSPTGGFRDPRTAKLDLEISRKLPQGFEVALTGRYHHTDYLLRRTDLNLPTTPTGVTEEGRPVYGTLIQQGGLIVAAPNSNRRFSEYDLVSAFSSTSAQDFYEARLSVSRELARGLSVSGVFSLSRTRDNWLQSWTGDPADELTPFPNDPIGGGWAKGVSDFDIPQRFLLTATWRSTGKVGVSLVGRYRYQSGLPFTPGFQPGVDANGDGSGRNDPAFLDPTIPGLPGLIPRFSCLGDQVNAFAARNSCRDPGQNAVDFGASVALPVRSVGGHVQLTFDIINLVSSQAGIWDHALVLVNPAGTLTTDASGNVTLPLIANPHFGQLLSRRDEPRILRVGLRFGNW